MIINFFFSSSFKQTALIKAKGTIQILRHSITFFI